MASDLARDLELSVRAGNCLRANGVNTLHDFLALTDKEVLSWRNAGRRTWIEIADMQARLRSRFAPPPPMHPAAELAAMTLNTLMRSDPSLRVVLNRDGTVALAHTTENHR